MKRQVRPMIGLVGGMGTHAGTAIFSEIFKTIKAEKDQDFIEVIVHSNPMIPDRTAHLLHGNQSPLKELLRSVHILEDAGATEIILGCITAHAYLNDLQCELKNANIVNIPDTAADFIKTEMPGFRRVGVLCSEGTAKIGIWEKVLDGRGITPSYLSASCQKELFNDVIYGSEGVKAGGFSDSNKLKLKEAVRQLKSDGADIVLGSCSELPLLLPHGFVDYYVDVFSIAARLLADRLLKDTEEK